MSTDPRLDVLPQFEIQEIRVGEENALVTGRFDSVERIENGERGYLFVPDEPSIADIVSLEGEVAVLDIPRSCLTDHIREGATLPWLNAWWNAPCVTSLLDKSKAWQRVEYRATEARVFMTNTLNCEKCGWVGDPTTWKEPICAKCSGKLRTFELRGWNDADSPLGPNDRFVEKRTGYWDHDRCLICNLLINADTPYAYRELSDVGGPNSVGIWLCEACHDNYLARDDFSFLV